MNPEEWAKVENLFHQLRNLPQAERAAFLERTGQISPEVRQQVESLMAHDHPDEQSFHQAFVNAAADALRKDTAQSTSLVGCSIGHYQVVSFIAAGGMGEVYRARHAKLDRDVALKLLPAKVSQDPEWLRRSEHEAKLLASLNHPNIAFIYDLVNSGGIQCLVLEYVEGQTLAERLKRGRLPTSEALDIARQIAEALESAHERGIVHRDLKPGNVMITADGTVKILDFGIAKILRPENSADTAAAAESTSERPASGTPAYMSPEQMKGQPVNRTSDIWAFGCVLYEMLTARRGFDEPDWTALPADTPPEILKLLQRCLKKDSRSRLQNMGDARIEIEEVRSRPQTGQPAAAPMAKKSPLAWISAFALVAMLAVVLGIVAFRPEAKAPEMRLEIATASAANPNSSPLAVSPDGQKIVFVATTAGQTALWLRPIGSSAARPLAGTGNAEFPFWSPDSQSVAFFADERLKRVDIDGGASRVLAKAPLGRGGTWNRAGVILFTPNNSGPIFRVSAGGGEAEPVTKIEGPGGNDRLPSFMPDGRHFLYFSRKGIYVAELDGAEGRRIADATGKAEYSSSGYLVFERQPALVAQRFDPVRLTLTGDPSTVVDSVLSGAWSVSASGPIIYRNAPAQVDAQPELVWVDRSGKMVEQIGVRLAYRNLGLSLSPDARQLVIQGRTANADRGYLWILQLQGGALSLFTDLFPSTYPIWSPDAGRIVFGHNDPNTNMDLYQKRTNGAGMEQFLLRTSANKAATDWSTAGRFLLYRTPDPKTAFDIYALPMDGNNEPFEVVRTNADERDGQFAPDGKWVAYQSNESGRFEIYVQPFPGPGRRQPISTNGGAQVRWSRDGRELFYIALDGRLMSVPIRVAADGKSLDAGAAVPLFPTRINALQFDRQQYFVSPDGQRFLISAPPEEAAASPIRVILNYKPKT